MNATKLASVIWVLAWAVGCGGGSSDEGFPGGGDTQDAAGDTGSDAGDASDAKTDATDAKSDGADAGDGGDASDAHEGGDGGGATADIATTAIDFGSSDCGGTAPAAQTLAVHNTGTAPLTFSATLDASTYFDLSGATGTVAAGATEQITITPKAITTSDTAGATHTSTITIATNDGAHASVSVDAKITPQGGTLTLVPATASFGVVPIGTTAPAIPLTLTNTGNQAVSVLIGAPADGQFGVSWGSAPADVALAPGDSVTGLSASFAPIAAGLLTDSAPLTVTGALCNTDINAIALSGEGTTGALGISPSEVSFGLVDCSAQAAPQTVTLSNSGTSPFHFTVALGAGAVSPYTIAPESGTVDAGGNATLTLTPSAIPATSAVTDDLYADALVVTTDIFGDTQHLVAIHETAHGIILGASPGSVDFGDVPTQSTSTSDLTLTNNGNATATVTVTGPGAPFDATGGGSLSAGGSTVVTAAFAPTAIGAQSGALTLGVAAGEALCAPLPSVGIGGRGTGGGVGLSTTSISFGEVPCGTQAAPQTVTVTNTGTSAFTYTATLGKGAGATYSLQAPTGSLQPGESSAITVVPWFIGSVSSTAADLYADTLSITTDLPSDSPHTVQLHETARGAIIQLNPASVDFGNVPVGASSASDFTLTNVGNSPATVYLGPNGDPTFKLSGYGPYSLTTGDVATTTVTFKPTAAASSTGGVAFGVSGIDYLCAPLPALALNGAGTQGALAVSPPTVDFGQVDCGGQAQPKTFTLQNVGGAPLSFTLANSTANFVVTPTTGTLASGASTDITVTPGPIPAQSDVTPNLYGDVIVVKTDVAGDVDHPVPVVETAHGAILSLPTTSIDFGGVGTGLSSGYQVTVTNTGNADATVSYATTNPVFSVGPQGQVISGGTSGYPVALFSPTQQVGYLDVASLSVSSDTVLCRPIPADIALKGSGTAGSVKVTATDLNFGLVDCGTVSAPQTTVLQNQTGAPITFSTALGRGATSPYVVTPASGTLAAGASQFLTVTPKPIPQTASTTGDAFADLLTITTNAPGDAAHNVNLHESAHGAVLGFTVASVNFGYVFLGNTATRNFSVTNTGNASAGFTLTVGGPNAGDFGVAPKTNTAAAAGSAAETASFTGPANPFATVHGTISLSTNAVLCAPLPTAIALSGT